MLDEMKYEPFMIEDIAKNFIKIDTDDYLKNLNDLVLIMFVNKNPSVCDQFNLTNTTPLMMMSISLLLFSIFDKVYC